MSKFKIILWVLLWLSIFTYVFADLQIRKSISDTVVYIKSLVLTNNWLSNWAVKINLNWSDWTASFSWNITSYWTVKWNTMCIWTNCQSSWPIYTWSISVYTERVSTSWSTWIITLSCVSWEKLLNAWIEYENIHSWWYYSIFGDVWINHSISSAKTNCGWSNCKLHIYCVTN